ncbi:hypothetical protein MHYP_G00361710 [Metynnis hypsauchen]
MAVLIGAFGAFDESVETWGAYTERFDFFVAANSIKDDVKVATFLSVMGAKVFSLLRSLVQPEKPGNMSCTDIVKVLDSHYSPKPLQIAERFRFRNQEEEETIAQYVAVLKRLTKHCDFKDNLDDALHDRDWATPVVPVLKQDGSVRLCGDFKVAVNPVLIAEQYPLSVIEDLFAGLAGGKKFSKIDLCQAYLQMHVEESSQKYLTITTHRGLFRYCQLPFGITSAPALFQRAMDQILSGLPGVQCYLDDILVTGRNDTEHLNNLDRALGRLEEYGLRVRKDKCDFFKSSVEYLGHVIDSDGLHTAPSKLKAIVDAPVPGNVSQLRSFLGLLNYYGRFIPQLATLLKPMHELLCDGKTWKWSKECDMAFNKAKAALTNETVLIHFDPTWCSQL